MNNAENPVKALVEAYEASERKVEMLEESIAEVRAMMDYDSQGWKLIAGVASGERLEGLDIEEVQAVAEKIAPRVAAGALPKRAADLHAGFNFGRGYYIEGTEKPTGRGKPTNLRAFFTKTANQEALFSESAGEELQRARFITGNVLLACNTKKKEVNRIPFSQIIDVKVDPDFPENVIAYCREWDTGLGTQDSVRRRWYYTKRYEGSRQGSYAKNGETIQVDKDVTIVDLRANRQVGHVLGIPDGLAGLHWAEAYGQILQYGQVVSESLAKILYKVINKTAQGTKTTGLKISSFGGHGGTASMAEGQDLAAVSTAGRGYEFSHARPVAAMAAAAWNVSNMDLLNDSSAAGSSYGSANALVPGNRNAMILMQKEWGSVFQDVFEVMGLGRPRITWEPLETPDVYRSAQALTLLSPNLHDEELRMKSLDILDIVGESSDIPESLKMRNEPAQTAAQQSAPDQGRANGSGGGGQGANDMRSDGIGESIRREMANEDFLARFEELVMRAEAAKGE